MEIKRYNIPKLPRSKYNVTGNYSSKYLGTSSIITNYNADVYDGLDSTSTEKALSAYLGKVLNDGKLSKNKADTAKEIITFDKGLISNKDVFIGGFHKNSNLGIGLYKDNFGNWNLEVDNAKIRGKLEAENISIEEVKYIGGKLFCTKAGITCTKVEKLDTVFRCYFKLIDAEGNEIHNQFVTGDLAFTQTFTQNNRKWWREVTNVGKDFIDVSIGNCLKPSDNPEVGDNIVQLGNLSDKERLGALIIEPLQINIYNQIKSFVLPVPKISLNPYNSKIDADSINFLGQTIINGNFKVDNSGNLEIKGKIEADEGYFKGFISKRKTIITNENFMLYFTLQNDKYNLDLFKSGTWIVFDKSFNKSNLNCTLPYLQDFRVTGDYQSLYDEVRMLSGNNVLIYNYSKTPINFGRFFKIASNTGYTDKEIITLNNQQMASLTLNIGGVENETSFWKGYLCGIKNI